MKGSEDETFGFLFLLVTSVWVLPVDLTHQIIENL